MSYRGGPRSCYAFVATNCFSDSELALRRDLLHMKCLLPTTISQIVMQGSPKNSQRRQPRDYVHERLARKQEVSIICTILYFQGCCVASVYLMSPETSASSVYLLELPPRA